MKTVSFVPVCFLFVEVFDVNLVSLARKQGVIRVA